MNFAYSNWSLTHSTACFLKTSKSPPLNHISVFRTPEHDDLVKVLHRYTATFMWHRWWIAVAVVFLVTQNSATLLTISFLPFSTATAITKSSRQASFQERQNIATLRTGGNHCPTSTMNWRVLSAQKSTRTRTRRTQDAKSWGSRKRERRNDCFHFKLFLNKSNSS